MGSLALRPGGSLTIHEMALSIGFRIFSFRPSCYSSYGASNFYPGGTFTHCSCQPSLDAHFSFLTQRLNSGCRRGFHIPPGTGIRWWTAAR